MYTGKSLENILAEEAFALYWKGYFNISWENRKDTVVDGLEKHFKEIIEKYEELSK